MKKTVLATSLITLAIWLGISSLLLSVGMSVNANQVDLIAAGMDDQSKTFRPVEFSAEVNMAESETAAAKIDLNVIQKLNQAKEDMKQVCGSHSPAAVR